MLGCQKHGGGGVGVGVEVGKQQSSAGVRLSASSSTSPLQEQLGSSPCLSGGQPPSMALRRKLRLVLLLICSGSCSQDLRLSCGNSPWTRLSCAGWP